MHEGKPDEKNVQYNGRGWPDGWIVGKPGVGQKRGWRNLAGLVLGSVRPAKAGMNSG